MKCVTCDNEMTCIDDINEDATRIDWFKCKNCNTEMEVQYDRRMRVLSTRITYKS